MTIETTDQLIEKVKAGDGQAFAMLVDSHKNLVFSLTLQLLKNKQEAEEIAQDVFVKVYSAIHTFKGDSKFSTWLYRITRNRCLDYLRQKRIIFSDIDLNEFSISNLDDASNALDKMMEKERQQKLKHCLKLLSADDAAVLTLFYFEEKNLNEVAKILETSVNSTKVRLHRARKRLAAILIDQLEPETIRSYG